MDKTRLTVIVIAIAVIWLSMSWPERHPTEEHAMVATTADNASAAGSAAATQQTAAATPTPAATAVENDALPLEEGAERRAYDEITVLGSEIPDYGLYTYVLFPQKADPGSATARRYAELMRRIKSGIGTAAAADAPIGACNIFYLPAGDADERRNFSRELLARLHRAGMPAAGGAGPLLVSSTQPLGDATGSVLVADLGATASDGMDAVVAAYAEPLPANGKRLAGMQQRLHAHIGGGSLSLVTLSPHA